MTFYNVCFTIAHFSDIFRVGRWKQNSDISDELSTLKARLPEYCLSSRSLNTRKKYQYAFNAFCKWTKIHNITPLPSSDYTVSLYLIHISQNAKSASKINEVIYAISWAHKLAGFNNPCTSELVTFVNEGAQRKLGHFITKKDPITPDILRKIVHTYGTLNSNLKDLRTVCMCLLSYAGFLRFSELVNLRGIDIKIYSTHANLYLAKSKTDIYREGRDVVISRTNLVTCPVSMLERYLKLASITSNSDEFVFRSVNFCKSDNSYKLRSTGPLSYTRAREILLSSLQSIGLDSKKFGLHSLRSGGASAAAAAGVEDRLFKKHGRWKSDTAKDGYVKESLKDRLSVTNNIGI